MLSGAAPVRQAPPARPRRLIYAKSALALAAAAAGAFSLGSTAFAQTTPNNGQGTYTAAGPQGTYSPAMPNNISVTDQTNTGGGLVIDYAQTVSFSGLNINSSPTGQGSFRLTTYATDLTLTATGAASTFTTTANQFGILAYSQNALTANLGAVTVNAGSTGIYAYTGYGDVNFTTTGGSVTSTNYQAVTLQAGANLTANLASTVMSADDGINAAGNAVNLINSGQITSGARGINTTAYDGSLSLTNSGVISSQYGVYAETYGGLLTLNNTAAITSNTYYGIEAYSDNDAMSLTNSGTINSYYSGINAYSAGALTANNTGAITSSNSDALDLSGGGDVMLTNGGAISAAQGTGLNVNTSGAIAITNTGAITAGDGLGGDTAGVGIYAFGNGTLNFTSSGGAISGYDGVRLFGGSDVTVNSASAITAGRFGLDAESGQGGAVSVTSSGTIDASNASGGLIAIYAANGTAGTSTVVNVNGAIGGTTAVGTGVEINAASGGPTTNTVNVNANISSMLDGVLVDDAGVTVNVANGVTVSSTGSYGIENDGGGALVVNNNGTITSSGARAIDSQQDLTLVNTAGGVISSSGASDTVYARGVANVLNAGSITSSVSSGVVGSVGSVITNATGGSIQGGTDATTGAAVQLTGQSGVINNYGTLTDGGAGSIIVNNNQASTPAGVVAVNLFAGSTTGAVNFADAPNATLSLYNGTGTNNPGVTDTATGVQLQAAGTNSQATVGAVTGAYGLILAGTGDGTGPNGAAGTLDFANFNTATSLTKQDSGTWTVSGTAVYTGATTITAGTLALGNGASIASSSNVALTGATSILDLTAANGAQTINNLSGVAGSQVRLATAFSNIFGKGVVPSPISNTINQTTNTIFAGNISGAVGVPAFGGGATLTKTGAATLTLTGVNTYSGPLTISAGKLALAGGGSVANTSVANAGTFDISGLTNGGASIISLSGTGATTLGANTLTLTGAADTYAGAASGTGGLTIAAGTETLTGANTYTGATTIAAGATLALGGSGSIAASAVADAGTLDISNHTGGTSIAGLSGAGAVTLGANTLTLTNGGTFAGVASGTGGLTVAAGNEVLTGDNTYTGTTTISGGDLTLGAGGTTGSVAGPIALTSGVLTINHSNAVSLAAISGGGSLVQAGTGTTTLTGANTYTGSTTISGGTLALGGAGSIAASSGVVDNATFDISGHAGGASIKSLSGTGGSVLGANTLTLTNAAGIYAGAASGTGGLAVTGGTETVTGANTYTGATTIGAGATLALGGAGSIASSSGVADGGTFNIASHAGGVSIRSLSGAGAVTLGANTLTLTNAAGSYAGVASGTGGLTVSAGTETLTGANTYTGATTIAAGAGLTLGAGGDISYSSGVAANGTLNVSGVNGGYTLIQGLSGASTGVVVLGASYLEISTPLTFAGVISGTGSLQIDNGPPSQQGVFAATNTGVSTLTGDNTSTGRTNFAGTLNLGAGGTTGSVAGPITIYSANGSLNVNHSNAVTLGQVISGFGGLQQVGSGTTTITAADTYTGATTISAGTLALGGAGSIAASSGVVDNATFDISGLTGGASIKSLSGTGGITLGATTLTLTNASGAYAGVASGMGGITVSGGTETLTGADTYTGATTIASGATLALGGAASIAASSGIADAGTFNIAGHTGGVSITSLSGPGAVVLGANTLALTNAAGTYAGAASGTGGIMISGGTETLTGASTYTGLTTIGAGAILALGGTGSIAPSSVADAGTFSISGHTGGATIAGLSGAGAVTLGANTLTLTNGGSFAGVASGTGGLTVAAGNEVLTGANTYTGTTTIFGGNLTLGAGGTTGSVTGPIALSSGVLTINRSNAVSLAAISGGGSLVQAGTGTTTLTGANTYTGSTTISGGTLALGGAGSIATSSGVVDNATFDISGHTGGASIAGLSGTGAVTLGANTLTLTNGGTFAGVASGTGGLTVAAGNEVLTGNNTYTGATTISGGNLTLGAGGTTGSVAGPIVLASGVLTINRSNAVSLAAISGGGSLVQAGTGVTTLTGANTYTGSTTISGGTLALGAGGDLSYSSGVRADAALNVSGVNGGYTLIQGLTGASTGTVALGATYLEVSTPLNFAGVISGTGSLQIDNGPPSQQGVFAATNTGVSTLTGDNTYTGRTTFAGTLNLGAGGTTGSVAGPITIYSANGSLNVNHSNAVTLGQVISGFGGLQQVGSGTTTITAADTYKGATTIVAGTLALSGAGSIASSAVVDNATFDISGHTGGTTIAGLSGAGAVLLGANTLTLGNGGTFAGVASGTGGLTITAGDEVLTGNNTYTGATTVSGGNLTLGGGGTTGSVAGPIALASGVLTINRSDAVSLAAISGGGSLVQAGSGVTTLTGANTYTGSTTIAAGTLALGANATLASQQVALTGASAVFDATALPSLTLADLSGVAGSQVKATGLVTLGSGNSTTFAGALTSTGGLTKVGSGMLTLAGPNGFVGPVAINAGVLAVSGGSAIPDASVVTVGAGAGFQVLSNETVANIAGSGAIGLSSGAALTFGGDNQASNFATFMGTGDLIKTGTGVFTLNGANASTGRTTVSGGVLQLGTNARIAGAVTVASGASLTGSGAVGALNVASGATLSPGVAAGDFGTITASSLTTAGTIRIDFGGNSTGSKSDKIVVSGAINVTGGTIDAHPTSATNDYTFNQYFALTAGTTFTGQFTNSTDFTANPYDPRLKQRIRYDLGPEAVLEVRFLQDLTAGIATTGGGNAGAVAVALNGTEQGASDSFSVLINALADQSPGDRQRSLQLLSGEGAVDGQELVTAGLGAFIGVLGSHLADAAGDSAGSASAFGLFDAQGGASSRLGTLMAMSKNTVVGLGVGLGPNGASAPLGLHVWGQGFAVDRRIDSNGGLAGTTTSGEGFAAGVDAGLGHGLTVGGAVGYSNPQSKTSGRLAKAQGDSTFGGVYARYAMGPWFGGASFAYGGTSLDLQRSVTVGALTFNPHGKTDAESYGAGFLAGYRFTLRDGSRIDPMVTLDYGHTGEDAYSETNGGVAALRYDSVRLDEVIGTLGARWSKDFLVHGWKVTPDARLAAAVAGGDLGIDTGATFLAAPTGTGSFRTLGAKTPPNWGVAGVGVTLRPLGSSFDFKIGYEGNYASRFTDHHLAATVGYRF